MRLHGGLESWGARLVAALGLALALAAGCEGEQGAASGPREKGVLS